MSELLLLLGLHGRQSYCLRRVDLNKSMCASVLHERQSSAPWLHERQNSAPWLLPSAGGVRAFMFA